jgi:hypothetical protein
MTRHSQGPDIVLAAYTRDDLEALAELPEAFARVHLQLHLRGATLEFPDGLDEVQTRRLVDYAAVLDWHGQRTQ